MTIDIVQYLTILSRGRPSAVLPLVCVYLCRGEGRVGSGFKIRDLSMSVFSLSGQKLFYLLDMMQKDNLAFGNTCSLFNTLLLDK